MFKFGKRSLGNLEGVHPQLVQTLHDVMALQFMDFAVIDGVRTVAEQRKLVDKGVSKIMRSKHLLQEDGYSHAVDIVPWPLKWTDYANFGRLAGLMFCIAEKNGLILRWGGDWDRDGQVIDTRFLDLPHFEIYDFLSQEV